MKTIRLNESSFRRLLMNEIAKAPKEQYWFGKHDLGSVLSNLERYGDLHTDKYKDRDVEDKYRKWESAGFCKDCDEYVEWSDTLRSYMRYLARAVDYTLNRQTGGVGDQLVLDPLWLNRTKTASSDEYQCFYTLILKIYQNRPIWNDFFFNPEFSAMSNRYRQVAQEVRKDINHYRPILPIKEFNELNLYMMGYNPETRKLEGAGRNAREDLFCAPETNYEDFL